MKYSMQNQQGAVLIVSLILLLLITVIALSTVSSSTFQTSMVVNAQQRESIFRVAESAAEQTLTNSLLSEAYNTYLKNGSKPAPYSVPTADLTTPIADVTMTADLYHMGQGPKPIGMSLELFQNWIYESRGNAESSDKKLETQVVQGTGKLVYTGAATGTYDP